jgi:hypothetical protein
MPTMGKVASGTGEIFGVFSALTALRSKSSWGAAGEGFGLCCLPAFVAVMRISPGACYLSFEYKLLLMLGAYIP